MKRSILLCAVIVHSVVAFSGSNNLILIVEKQQDKVRMLWNFSELPDNVTGFRLQKRTSSKQKWQNAGKSMIRFGMHKKNIKNVEISSDSRKRLLEKYSKLLTQDDRLSSSNIHEYLSSHPDEKKFLLWALCMDYETSLISGLGFIDDFEEACEQWEYRVIPVINKNINEDLASEPVSVRRIDNFSKDMDIHAAFVKYDDKIHIHMQTGKKAFEEKNIKGFITYRVKSDGSKIPVSKYLAVPKRKKQGYTAVASAKNVDPEKSHTFVIQPVTIFDTRCEPILVNYRPN